MKLLATLGNGFLHLVSACFACPNQNFDSSSCNCQKFVFWRRGQQWIPTEIHSLRVTTCQVISLEQFTSSKSCMSSASSYIMSGDIVSWFDNCYSLNTREPASHDVGFTLDVTYISCEFWNVCELIRLLSVPRLHFSCVTLEPNCCGPNTGWKVALRENGGNDEWRGAQPILGWKVDTSARLGAMA